MNCVASSYNSSGKLVGCTESDLNAIISVQLYTVFAIGTGLYVYKSLTAENWADIAVQIGWGCVSAFTHTKRFTTRYVVPSICNAGSILLEYLKPNSIDSESEVDEEDNHCYVHMIKDGVELHGYTSIFGLINHLDEHSTENPEPRNSIDDSDDVVDVSVNDPTQESKTPEHGNEPEDKDKAEDGKEPEDDEDDEDEEDDDNIEGQLARIENHTMKFDFVMCQVPTLQTATSSTPQCMHVIKYDGFPRDIDGVRFCERKFVPVQHRMLEVVLQHAGAEYELDLATPDNFYVAGNKLLDPAFLKWFMRKNHGISLSTNDEPISYTIKCIDHNATLHTLLPCNHLHVSETGFEIHDSGLV
jgi:hypothetical protein